MVTPSDGSAVGVVGPAGPVRESLSDAGYDVLDGDAAAVVDAAPDWVVAVGEDALVDLVSAGIERPVLPVGAGIGVQSVPRSRAAAAVESVDAGAGETISRRLVAVDVGGERVGRALLDVLLVTDEPARISEYAVASGEDPVAQFRADGVVLATPSGSVGYADDAGGPVLYPETGSLSVVPIAPFVTDADHWVVGDDRVTVGVERETPVALVVDGRERRVVGAADTVAVSAGGSLSVLTVPESPPVHGAELEKH